MWTDEHFRALSRPQPNAQTLWPYLLCGPHTTPIPGLFPATQEGLAASLKWPLKAFKRVLAELQPRESKPGKHWLEADWDAGVVWIRGALLLNEPRNPNIVVGWKTTFNLIPECQLKRDAAAFMLSYGERRGTGFHRAFEKMVGRLSAHDPLHGSGNDLPNHSANGSRNHFANNQPNHSRNHFANHSPNNPPNRDQDQNQKQKRERTRRSAAPPDPPDSGPAEISSGHLQALDEAVRAVAHRLKRAAPRVSQGQRWQLAERVAEMRDLHGVSFAEAAEQIAETALLSGKTFVFAALEVDPFAKAVTPKPDPKRVGFLPPSTAEEFGEGSDLDAVFGPEVPADDKANGKGAWCNE